MPGDFILIHGMIFSDTSSKRLQRSSAESEKNWRACFIFFFLLHWTHISPTSRSQLPGHCTPGCSAPLLLHYTAGYTQHKNGKSANCLCTEPKAISYFELCFSFKRRYTDCIKMFYPCCLYRLEDVLSNVTLFLETWKQSCWLTTLFYGCLQLILVFINCLVTCWLSLINL